MTTVEGQAQAPEESNVCVAVKIRPLSATEVDDGCRESLFVTPGVPQITTGQHTFTYDHVFGEGGTMPDQLYPRCIAPLVAGLFKGYNATVFAYGQTGSGKTFTMGSEYKPGGRCRGVIPDAINDIFSRIEAAKDAAITVRVSFVEIHKEEIKDLLLPAGNGPRPAVTIRETQNGDVALYGAVEKEVRSREEMAEVLEMGTLCRSTASTSMNNRSSRSHAIFSIILEQRRQVQQASASTPNTETASMQGGDDEGEEDDEATGEDAEGVEDFLGAKMHLVDLAGSERAKRTKAEGARLREGIHINRGLLALGNVINAIVDNHKHVPYRDSKLTRLLQDSLGGNSRTVMIACVSPADSNFEESLNTLRYADRARHIKNKPTVNRDPVAAQIAVLRNTIAQLRSENMSLKRALAASGSEGGLADGFGGSSMSDRLGVSALENVVERLTQENSSLESDNMRLKMDMDELRQELALVTNKWHTAQAQCDLLRMNQAAAAAGISRYNGDGGAQDASAEANGALQLPGVDIVKGYLGRIAELEAEVKSMKSLAHLSFARRRAHGRDPHIPGEPGTPGDGPSAADMDGDLDPSADMQPELVAEEDYYLAELAARTLNQEKMRKEVAVLQRRLEEKERKMAELLKGSAMPHLKQQYDRALTDLEKERDKLLVDRKALHEKLAAVSAATEEEHKRLEAQYRERIREHDEQLKQLRHKERELMKMQKLKERTEAVQRQLSMEIQRLKQSRVAMQRQLDASAKQFASWRQEREKELAQLRKQNRRDRVTIQQLEAMQAKQNAVLQRKISEGNAARKRLKEYQELTSKRAAFVSSAASQQQVAAAAAQQQAIGGNLEIQPNLQAPLLRTDKDRREWLQKELDICNMSCEFRKIIDGEMAQRAEASRKLKELEKRLTLLEQLQPASPLLVAGGVGHDVSLSPGTVAAAAAAGCLTLGPEGREKLLAKRKELADKVAYHNTQISELQAQWERQKAEEELRGGGAMDPRRWAGLKNVVESRELLRTLFRLSVEAKTLCNDLTVDMVRYSEDVDLLRVQLEGAQQKAQYYKKWVVALQAAAGARFAESVPHHGGVSTQDETDKQADAILEMIAVTGNNTPSTAAGATTRNRRRSVPAEDVHVAAVSCNEDVEMEDVGTPGTPDASQGNMDMKPKALEFLSPVPSGMNRRARDQETPGTSSRYSPSHDDDSDEGEGDAAPQSKHSADDDAMDVDEEEEEEEEEEEVDSDSDDDIDWNPSNATPARGRGTRGSRRTSSLAAAGLPAEGVGRNSRRNSHRASAAADVEEGEEGEANAAGGRRQGGSRRASSRRSTTPDDAVLALEGPVLDDINLKRYSAGHPIRLTKLTVAVLKEALKGAIIDGQPWHAGNKNRATLIQDYRRLMGLDKMAPGEHSRAAADNSGAQDMSLLRCSRADSGKATRGVEELSFGGSKAQALEQPASSPVPPIANSEGFTFSPHQAAAACAAAAAAANAMPAPTPSRTPSARRTAAAASGLGPWARSSLNAQPHSARQYSSWASSLRASCTTLPGAAADGAAATDNGSSGGAVLLRAGSGSSSGTAADFASISNRKLTIATSSSRPEIIALNTAAVVQAGSNNSTGALRESLDYRGAVLSAPQPSASPRVPRPPAQTATGATSPRNSMGTPSPQIVYQRAGGKSPGSGGWSPCTSRGSRDRGAQGGENMQPGSTPRATTGGSTPGSGKGTPLTNLYKEKAAAARERTAALRVSMQRNWEPEPAQRSGGTAAQAGGAPRHIPFLAAGGTTGMVTSSLEVARGAALRDSGTGALAAAAGAQKQKAIWR